MGRFSNGSKKGTNVDDGDTVTKVGDTENERERTALAKEIMREKERERAEEIERDNFTLFDRWEPTRTRNERPAQLGISGVFLGHFALKLRTISTDLTFCL